jgi:hypothetical protein
MSVKLVTASLIVLQLAYCKSSESQESAASAATSSTEFCGVPYSVEGSQNESGATITGVVLWDVSPDQEAAIEGGFFDFGSQETLRVKDQRVFRALENLGNLNLANQLTESGEGKISRNELRLCVDGFEISTSSVRGQTHRFADNVQKMSLLDVNTNKTLFAGAVPEELDLAQNANPDNLNLDTLDMYFSLAKDEAQFYISFGVACEENGGYENISRNLICGIVDHGETDQQYILTRCFLLCRNGAYEHGNVCAWPHKVGLSLEDGSCDM